MKTITLKRVKNQEGKIELVIEGLEKLSQTELCSLVYEANYKRNDFITEFCYLDVKSALGKQARKVFNTNFKGLSEAICAAGMDVIHYVEAKEER
jgi:hypothetical protein